MRRGKSFSIWMPLTTRCMGTKRGASSTAITIATATCRFTFFAAGTSLAAKLRRSNIDASAGAVEEVTRIVDHIRARWPRLRICCAPTQGLPANS